ncbi:imelysin family protein [Neotabrizicola shimadae]|uniref:Imelysin family protein n=1 Tax=Neotabrizicola shimadae TaxID=2807096 RepID=A0A8G1EBT6_9RHOB|nr:imelysin family protein [Neotabrizicola shimadae]QYZ68471.1 imelysin family protein [Neotabrizicola shimadae]
MRHLVLCLLALMPLPATAGVREAVEAQILPGYAGFAEAADRLAVAAAADCSPEALRPDWNAAFDAWLRVGFLHLGPGEDSGRTLAIAFWPDPKGIGAKQQAGLIRTGDVAVLEPSAFAMQSVAVRGLFALERLLYPAPDDPAAAGGDYVCALTRATAADLARMANGILSDWRDGYADVLLTAGEPGNETYLTEAEAAQALYTQLITGLEFVKDQRLGRPLGTFDAPKPERAEARASGRSLRNVDLSLEAMRDFSLALAPKSPDTEAAFASALAVAEALEDPVLAGVGEPDGRLKVEILQQHVTTIVDAAVSEVGPALGVDVGFNAADGD